MSDAIDEPVDRLDGRISRSPKLGTSPRFAMIAAAILTAFAVAAAGSTIWNLHERVEQDTQEDLNRLALVIADQTSRSFQAVDLILRDAVDRIAAAPISNFQQGGMAGKAMHEYLLGQSAGLPQVANLILIDARGEYTNSARRWPVPPMSLADREQFRHCRDNDKPGLFVSEPVRNKVDGAWTLYLARRLDDTDGKFLGVVQAAVRLKHFEDFYGSVALGEGGSIVLLRHDGMMLARHPLVEGLIGRVVEDQWREVKAGNDAKPKELWSKGLDGKVRFVAFKAVPGFPLAISTSLTYEAVLGSWRRDAAILILGTSGAVAGILLLLMVLARKIRGMRHSEALFAQQNLKLERSQRLLLDAQRIGKLGHWSSDPWGNNTVCSQQLFEIAGISPAPLVSFETLVSWVHPDDVSDFLLAGKRSRGRHFVHEHRWVRPDGSIRWVRMEADPKLGPDNKVVGQFGIVQDITERKEVEQVAEESRHRLFDAIESMSQGFVLYDSEDRFVLANTHFREMFPELSSLLRPGARYEDVILASYERGLLAKVELVSQIMAWHRAGSKPIERLHHGSWIQFIEHRTSDGGTAGLMTDITEFKTIQATLEQKLSDLERIRNDLEAQKKELVATSTDLISARDAAEAASRAKSDFLAIMSHEIRTPLSGMVGMIDLLRETMLNQEQQRFTTLAKESSDGLLRVINDILDFSKLEAGRLSPEAIDFDLRHLIGGVGSLLDARARDKGLDLTVSLSPDLPQWLKGDPNRIRQILLNLVNNAIKFTETGHIGVSASHRDAGDGSVEVRIEVVDSGIGIGAETQAQLFSPFVQADTSISRKYGGSGLGLAICKQLCTMMSGTIGVSSASGAGSTFWFTVRCRPGEPCTIESPALVPDAGLSLRILVAEDSPIIATLISTLLKKHGFSKPDMVVNGKQAVAAVSQESYDVVLMDVQMPEMDGVSATRAIRNLASPGRTVPIIALTANALVGQRETYLAAGMDDYVTKPIQPSTLFAAINRWAARNRSASGRNASPAARTPGA